MADGDSGGDTAYVRILPNSESKQELVGSRGRACRAMRCRYGPCRLGGASFATIGAPAHLAVVSCITGSTWTRTAERSGPPSSQWRNTTGAFSQRARTA